MRLVSILFAFLIIVQSRTQFDANLGKSQRLDVEKIQHYEWLMDNLASLPKTVEYYRQSILENEARRSHLKFKDPPEEMIREYLKDNVTDLWEVRYAEKADYRPIIGILTQPRKSSNGTNTTGETYVLEVNDIFHKWSGSRTIAIPYDISERGLKTLLGNINGVHLTGGGLELIDKDGNMHPYYVTAKRIIEFSKSVKDNSSSDFPVFGVCQGLELLSIAQNGDNATTLDNVTYFGMRKVQWNNSTTSRFYKDFPESTRLAMNEMNLAFHLHEYGIKLDTFNNAPGLREEMVITQLDHGIKGGPAFIDAMEHKKYPLFAVMYHPEYQLFQPYKSVRTEEYDRLAFEIAFRHSIALNRWARKNDFTWTLGEENLIRLAVDRVPVHMLKGYEYGSYIYG